MHDLIKKQDSESIYYPYFDYLRAVCAIVVMLYHAKFLTWEHSGDLAVQVFFALSGWLIGGVLIKTEPTQLFRFFYNRAIRIWVPYYIALGMFLTLSALREPITSKWIEIVVYKITFVYNIFGTPQLAEFAESMPQKATLNHVWSVNAEEQFYLVAPLLLVLGARFFGRHLTTWVFISIIAIIFNIYPSIIFGVTAAITNSQTFFARKIFQKERIGILSLIIFCIPLLTINNLYPYLSPIVSIALVMLLAKQGKELYRGRIIGGMSYPLYLNHWIGIYAINYLLPTLRNTTASAFFSSIISVLIATVMYILIDKKLLSMRNAFYTETKGMWITALAYALIIIGMTYNSLIY